MNKKKTDDKYCQYAVTVEVNYGASNIKLLIDKYYWKGIHYLSKIDDWKTFEKNNITNALNILYIKEKEMPSFYFKA